MNGQRGRDGTRAVNAAFERPEPPDPLKEGQAAVWRTTVEAMPPEWFPPETTELLTQYCRHVTT